MEQDPVQDQRRKLAQGCTSGVFSHGESSDMQNIRAFVSLMNGYNAETMRTESLESLHSHWAGHIFKGLQKVEICETIGCYDVELIQVEGINVVVFGQWQY